MYCLSHSTGYLGVFYMKTNWLTLGREPVQIFIEDLHLLVASSAHSESTVEEDEERAQRAKMERLENAELLHFPQDEKGTGTVSLRRPD